MDSSPVLCQQNSNKLHRLKNEHNRKKADPKPNSKLVPAPHTDAENKDPGNTEICKKPPLRPCVSRIPVMAKSLRLQTPSVFSQSHCRWEEKPLAIKAKKKKTSTRPVPFNLSEHRSTASKNLQPLSVLQPSSATENNTCKVKPAKPQTVLTSNARKGNPSQADVLSVIQQKAPQRCTSVMKTRQKHGATAETLNLVNFTLDPDALQSILQNEGVTAATPRSSVCPAGRGTSVYSAQRVPVRKKYAEGADGKAAVALKDTQSKTPLRVAAIKHQPPPPAAVIQKLFDDKEDEQSTNVTGKGPITQAEHQRRPSKDKGENVQLDHVALLSILQKRAQSVTGLTSGTPQSKLYDSLPQRVPVKKSRQSEVHTETWKSVDFTLDPDALQSILQNEGVTAATPRSSVCSAQRVPVRKNRAKSAGGAAAVALKETPSKKWTPQRVPNIKHQPMSAVKWPLSRGPSLYGSPAFKSCKSIIRPQQEEIVQRLFDDKEGEQRTKVTDRDLSIQAEQLPVRSSAADVCEQLKSVSSDEEEQESAGGQMFLQAPHRESVIHFSTGKNLIRAPRIEKQESPAQQDQQASCSSLHRNDEEPAARTKASVQHVQRDVQKTCSQISAAAMLRKRFTPLEELLLDEEVATYTSRSVSSLPAWPRCGNPLASILHFEESTRFVPISFEPSSESSSPHGAALQER